MNTEELQQLVLEALDDLKAVNVTVLDVHKQTTVTDRMVIASGTSSRHVKSLADNVAMAAKKAGYAGPRCRGRARGRVGAGRLWRCGGARHATRCAEFL